MEFKDITQYVTFPVSPGKFYEVFLSSETHTEFTGAGASITDQEGDEFSAHDGYCYGKNLELEPGEKIVQSWVAMEDYWPDGHESKITLLLTGDENETQVEFHHEHVPEDGVDALASGWQDYYWEPLQEYFAK